MLPGGIYSCKDALFLVSYIGLWEAESAVVSGRYLMDVVYTNSEEETAEWAAELAKTLKPGCFIAVDGELGAGKTAFAKGVARGLGVRETIVSPTFTFLRAYESGRLPLYHFDVYRISGTEELDDIGFFDYMEGDGICVCEWAELIAGELPEKRLEIRIERVDGGGTRKLTLSGPVEGCVGAGL